MFTYPLTAEIARRRYDERLAAAERRHRLFRRPVDNGQPAVVAEVVPLPTPAPAAEPVPASAETARVA